MCDKYLYLSMFALFINAFIGYKDALCNFLKIVAFFLQSD